MSSQANTKSKNAEKVQNVRRLTVPKLVQRKGEAPLVVLTAYSAPMARFLDPHCEILLVGDSVGMALYGMESTLGVTLDMMINHGRAVVRGSSRALVVIDMPFGSYETSPEQAFSNAARVLAETGAQAVKLEGGVEMAPTVRFLVQRGIPVMGHVGLCPQSVNTLGGYAARGREEEGWASIIDDAHAIAEAGAFSTVLEGVAAPLADKIAADVPNLIIGIGASAQCDGQVLVTEDMLGFFDWTPKFVKRYAEISKTVDDAARAFADDVRARRFPDEAHVYKMRKTTD